MEDLTWWILCVQHLPCGNCSVSVMSLSVNGFVVGVHAVSCFSLRSGRMWKYTYHHHRKCITLWMTTSLHSERMWNWMSASAASLHTAFHSFTLQCITLIAWFLFHCARQSALVFSVGLRDEHFASNYTFLKNGVEWSTWPFANGDEAREGQAPPPPLPSPPSTFTRGRHRLHRLWSNM